MLPLSLFAQDVEEVLKIMLSNERAAVQRETVKEPVKELSSSPSVLLPGRIELSIDRARAAVGDQLTVTVSYQHLPEWTPVQPANPAVWMSQWLVEGMRGPTNARINGYETQTWEFDVLATRSGVQVLPQPEWQIVSQRPSSAHHYR